MGAKVRYVSAPVKASQAPQVPSAKFAKNGWNDGEIVGDSANQLIVDYVL